MKDIKAKSRKGLEACLRFCNRFAHLIDIPIVIWIAAYIYEHMQNEFAFLIYLLPIWQIWQCVKWEIRVIRSNAIIRDTARNKRVQGFSGPQGSGKTSFMLHSLYVLHSKSIYTNFPCRIRGKYAKQLDENVLEAKQRITDGSILAIDEATLFYHNIMNAASASEENKVKLYSQQLHQQLLRHFYDGNMFYSSVDITRLPAMLRENIGMTNFMLGQGSVQLSYITGPLLKCIGRLFKIDLHGSIRYWDVQQLERIPENGYTFDLSTQEKDTNAKNFANLIRFCCFSSSNRFDYDDRFLRGLYAKLEEHIDTYWKSLSYDEKGLRKLGYGEIIDFFNARLDPDAVKAYAALPGHRTGRLRR